MFQKVLKSIQNGFKQIPGKVLQGVKVFNDTRSIVQKALPQAESAISKSKQIYDNVVKNEISPELQRKAEKAFDYSNATVNKIKKFDNAIEQSKRIINS